MKTKALWEYNSSPQLFSTTQGVNENKRKETSLFSRFLLLILLLVGVGGNAWADEKLATMPGTADGYSCSASTTTNSNYGLSGKDLYTIEKSSGSVVITVPENVQINTVKVIGVTNDNSSNAAISVNNSETQILGLRKVNEVEVTQPYELIFTITSQPVNHEFAIANKGSKDALVYVEFYGTTDGGDPTPSISITAHPVSASYPQFSAVTPLSVTATASNGATCTYQWKYSSSEDNNYSVIEGATNSTYTPSNINVEKKWYQCEVSAEGCADVTSSSAYVDITKGNKTTSDLVQITENYTYTPNAALPLGTLTSDNKILSAAGGCNYNGNGLNVKNNRYIAISVAAGALISVKAGNHTTKEDSRTLYISKVENATTESSVSIAKGATETLTLSPTEESIYYIHASSDLYIKQIDVKFAPEAPVFSIADNTTVKGTASGNVSLGSVSSEDGTTLYLKTSGSPIEDTAEQLAIEENKQNIVNRPLFTGGKGNRYYAAVAEKDGKLSGVTCVHYIVYQYPAITATDVTVNEGETGKSTITAKVGSNTVSDLNYSYRSNNKGIATVAADGTITGVAYGNTTVTVSSAENETNFYSAAEGTINVTVERDGDYTTVEGTATFTNAQMKQFGTTNTSYTTEDGNITLTDIANIIDNTAGARVQHDGTGDRTQGQFTIIPAAGVKIQQVDIVTNKSGSDKTITATYNDEDIAAERGENYSGSNYEWTYKFDDATGAITFTNKVSGENIIVKSINVKYTYEVSGVITPLVGTFANDVEQYAGTNGVAMPALVVKAGEAVAENTLYSVEYSSSNTDVVEIVDGHLNFKTVGNAAITATITPTNNETHVGGTATFNAVSKDKLYLTIDAPNVQLMNTEADKAAVNAIKHVYAGTTFVHTNGYTVTYEELTDEKDIFTVDNGNNTYANARINVATETIDETTLLKTGSGTFRVTVTPTGDLAANYQATSKTFTIVVTSQGAKRQAVIDFPNEIALNVNSSTILTPSVIYNERDITDYFTLSYEVETGATISNTNKLTAGASAATPKLTIKATPKSDYEELYETITKDVTVNISELLKFQSISVEPASDFSVPVGDPMDVISVEVTDENGDAADGYTVTYSSSAAAVVSVDNSGNMQALSMGKAKITILVSKTGYESVSKTFTVTVTDPTVFAIAKSDRYDTNGDGTADADAPNGFSVISVPGMEMTFGGWLFGNITSGSVIGQSYTYGSKNWAKAKSEPSGNRDGFDLAINGRNQENPRNEKGSNSLPHTSFYQKGTIDLPTNKEAARLIDPMFHVPAEGAYFKFAPQVNGTVIAHVLQNSAFENGNNGNKNADVKKKPYDDFAFRPQRRVFVVDEAGNVISSTAELDDQTATMPKSWWNVYYDKDNDNYRLYDGETDPYLHGLTENGGDDGKDNPSSSLKTKMNDATGSTISHEVEKPQPDLSIYQFDMYNSGTKFGKVGVTADEVKLFFKGMTSFNPNNFKNGVYESTIGTASDPLSAEQQLYNEVSDAPGMHGWVVLAEAPVTYTFKAEAGKTYYLYNFGSKLGFYGMEFKPDEEMVVDAHVELSETSADAIVASANNHVATVSVDRHFKPGIWNAAVLPFSLNKQQVDAIFGHTYDRNNLSGTQILYFDHVDEANNKIHFVRHAYNEIVAGKPFLIKPVYDVDGFDTRDLGDYKYVTIEKPVAESLSYGENTMGLFVDPYEWASSYAPFDIKPGDYIVNGATGNMVRYPKNQASDLHSNGFRGYLKAKTDAQRMSAKSLTVAISDFEDDVVTYIENVEFDEDGNFFERPTGAVYNINGQVVGYDYDSLKTLPKGIYVINGKKFTVR